MTDYFISASSRYAYEVDYYSKNGRALLDEEGKNIEKCEFKQYIHKETASFIYQGYSNIIVLVGAGASVLCTNDLIDDSFGKTVVMMANLINNEMKGDSNYYSL